MIYPPRGDSSTKNRILRSVKNTLSDKFGIIRVANLDAALSFLPCVKDRAHEIPRILYAVPPADPLDMS